MILKNICKNDFVFSKKMLQQRFDSIVRKTIKIGEDLVQLRTNPYIFERHKALLVSWYLYKISLLKKELS